MEKASLARASVQKLGQIVDGALWNSVSDQVYGMEQIGPQRKNRESIQKMKAFPVFRLYYLNVRWLL